MSLSKNELTFIAILLTLNAVYSVSWLGTIMYHSPYIELLINVSILYYAFRLYKNERSCGNYNRLLGVYFAWVAVQIVRGLFGCEIYMDYRQLVDGMVMLSLPLLIYLFNIPEITSYLYRNWLKYGIIVFLIFISWNIGFSSEYLTFLSLLSLFLLDLPRKWQVGIALTMIVWFGRLTDRAQIIRTVFIILSIVSFYKLNLSFAFLKRLHAFLYILPVVLLVLAIAGEFQIFQYIQDTYAGEEWASEEIIKQGKNRKISLVGDTRTFLYKENIQSSLEHGYVLWGRTPARGHDSYYFKMSDEGGRQMRSERHVDEMLVTNLYTWIGLIGLVLYSLIYLKGSILAVYKSNSSYMRYVGIFVAFKWALGWIEENNLFWCHSITTWMLIGMCYSEAFREMSDDDFKEWLLGCIPFRKQEDYA